MAERQFYFQDIPVETLRVFSTDRYMLCPTTAQAAVDEF